MVIIRPICDYSVGVYLNYKYTNITNVPKPQMSTNGVTKAPADPAVRHLRGAPNRCLNV